RLVTLHLQQARRGSIPTSTACLLPRVRRLRRMNLPASPDRHEPHVSTDSAPPALASSRRISTILPGDNPPLSRTPKTGGARRIAVIVSSFELRSKGCLPVSSSQRRMPKENRTERWSSGAPRHLLGRHILRRSSHRTRGGQRQVTTRTTGILEFV